MPKSTKHIDAVKSLDEFRAPWETEGGTDAEIDKSKLRRWIHGLLVDKAKAQDAREDANEATAAAEADRDRFKEEAEKASPEESNRKIARLEDSLQKVTKERDDLVSANDLAALRAEVLGNFATENPKAAKYVVGTTKEELEKSLESVREDFGITDEPGGNDDDDTVVRNRPRSGLSNAADRQNGKGAEQEIDFDRVASEILGGSPFQNG